MKQNEVIRFRISTERANRLRYYVRVKGTTMSGFLRDAIDQAVKPVGSSNSRIKQ